MALTLGQKQRLFPRLLFLLFNEADVLGYELTLGEAYRSPEEAERLHSLGKGSLLSLHTSRLAIDLNLFIEGVYQTTSEAHEPLGRFWESLSDPVAGYECCWGGRFRPADGNHYSIAHGGRK